MIELLFNDIDEFIKYLKDHGIKEAFITETKPGIEIKVITNNILIKFRKNWVDEDEVNGIRKKIEDNGIRTYVCKIEIKEK